MKVTDYNGTGFWSAEQILARYAVYAERFQIRDPRDLRPIVTVEGDKQWVYPVMDHVIAGIESGDMACAEIGVEFIEEDSKFAFGMTLKSNTARALRHIDLTFEQQERIRKRIVEMIRIQFVPREFRQYAKLARKIGLGSWISQLCESPDKWWVQRYYDYLKKHAAH